MNDRWTDVAHGVVEDALTELLDVEARIAALPIHAEAATTLRLRAGDLRHRIAAASGVLDAYGHPGAPGESADERERASPLPSPAPGVRRCTSASVPSPSLI